jgi:hypothetical protein
MTFPLPQMQAEVLPHPSLAFTFMASSLSPPPSRPHLCSCSWLRHSLSLPCPGTPMFAFRRSPRGCICVPVCIHVCVCIPARIHVCGRVRVHNRHPPLRSCQTRAPCSLSPVLCRVLYLETCTFSDNKVSCSICVKCHRCHALRWESYCMLTDNLLIYYHYAT